MALEGPIKVKGKSPKFQHQYMIEVGVGNLLVVRASVQPGSPKVGL